jgi:hypothetical protein
MKWKLGLSLAAGCFAAAIIGAVRNADAHKWYPQACCSGLDCEKIPVDSVRQNADGSYDVDYWSSRGFRVVAHVPAKSSQIRNSEDGSYHGCAGGNTMSGFSRFICLFVPVNT